MAHPAPPVAQVDPLTAEGEPIRAELLIWIDWVAGGVVGALMLCLRGWLTNFYALPADLLLLMGLANLAYACGAFTLAMLSRGGQVPFLRAVAAANIVWAAFCSAMAVVWFGEASVFGMGQLVGEAAFVGGLGVLEWRAAGRQAERLVVPGAAPDAAPQIVRDL